MAEPLEGDDLQPVLIGADGLAMLGLSGAILLLSLGTSLLLAFGYALRIALYAPSCVPLPARIIVLGIRLNGNGNPTPCYQARLDRALTLWQRSESSQIVILGGVTTPGTRSEAQAGALFLRERGVCAAAIEMEERSRHTLENLQQYRQRFPTDLTELPVLVTSRYHLARSSLLAAGLGIAHRRCAAEERWLAALWHLPRMLQEALLIHWYVSGRSFAWLTGNRSITARIS
jgi:uncharacterized SAM-binding protein YcdF (DUF218 family)